MVHRNKRMALLFTVLSIGWMGLIFWLSGRDATASSEQSNVLVALLERWFGTGADWSFIVRKLAHFGIFAILAFLMNTAWYFYRGRQQGYLPCAAASLYALTDEIHQSLIPGRSCELRDWGIDTLGAVTGTLVLTVLLHFINNKKGKKNKE